MLKHTQGAWISFPVSNWKKALDKMKAHKASAWHKMAKAKVEAEKQSQAEGSVILQLKQGKERWDEQTKQQNRILIKKLLRIMDFLCKQKIAHFSNFDEVFSLWWRMVMMKWGNFWIQLQEMPPTAASLRYLRILCWTHKLMASSEYLDAISLWVQQSILRSLKEAAFYTTIEEHSICFRWVDSSGSPLEHFLGLVSLSACDAACTESFSSRQWHWCWETERTGIWRGCYLLRHKEWSSNVYPCIGTTSIVLCGRQWSHRDCLYNLNRVLTITVVTVELMYNQSFVLFHIKCI